MKTIALLAILLLPACTADVFATPGDDAGPVPNTDAGTDTDATPDTDAAPALDSSAAADSTDDADAATPVKDAAADSNAADADAGPVPLCAPLGYKACQSGQSSKCKVSANDGTATCVVPGSTPHYSACSKDDDCGNNEICDVSLCRSLCQKTYQTPWGSNANTWAYSNCAGCPVNSTSNYQLSRLPSWLGVCMY